MTIKGKLLAKEQDLEGYITYVFQNLEFTNYLDKYIMCTQYPNWDTGILNINDEGYVTVEEHIAGIDKWFDGATFIPYKYTGVQFIRFVPQQDKLDNKITF